MVAEAQVRPGWSGALLIGGASRRMGRDKLRLPFEDGRPLVEVPAEALRRCCRPCFAVGRSRTPGWSLSGFEPLDDALPDAGPLAAVVAALEASPNPWVLVLAGDLPQIGEEFLLELQQRAEDQPQRACLPQSRRGLEPLVAAYPKSLAEEFREALEKGERALRRAIPREKLQVWTYEESREGGRLWDPFCNLNTQEDWDRFHHRRKPKTF
ncbi:MAG: molybdenum cofactor guanylyltransferase [Planctomycetota bacterium]|nr:MAG: molybdenum cofactor guanylyltransferase [Planctomycetota bacterium]